MVEQTKQHTTLHHANIPEFMNAIKQENLAPT